MIRAAIVAALSAIIIPAHAMSGPLGFIDFCESNPAHCKAAPAAEIDMGLHGDILRAVNASVNASIKPRADTVDVWTLNPAYGDCEDYAITKRALLIQAGLPAGALRIAVGRSPSGPHAVLVAITNQGAVVLDNLNARIVPIGNANIRISAMSSANPKVWFKP